MTLYGLLKLSASDRIYANTVGQRVIFDAANEYLRMYNEQAAIAERIFVEETTENYSERYKLIGGGYMQRLNSLSRPGAVRPQPQWDVAYKLEAFGDDVGWSKREFAYMLVSDVQRGVDNIRVRSLNTRRFEMLKALFTNTTTSWIDPLNGTLTLQPLAITSDGVLYPPVMGAIEPATAQHYLASGYVAADISNTNNPFPTIAAKFSAFSGTANNVVVFINSAQRAKVEALTNFYAVDNPNLRTGSGETVSVVPSSYPAIPGNLIGSVDGVWVSVWDFIPASYMLGVDLDAPAPLKRRMHPGYTGLGDGLRLVAKSDIHPLELSSYEDDFGYGIGNRLGAVVMELTTDATYDIPAAYA